MMKFLGIGLAALVLLISYACWIEPYWIEVSRHRIEADVNPPLTIAHLTDLHILRGIGPRERKILELLRKERPDLIVLTGDTVDRHGTLEGCRPFLCQLKAPLGVWMIQGNWENSQPAPEEGEGNFYSSMEVIFLRNEGRLLRPDIWIAGFDDETSGSPKLEPAFKGKPPGIFTLALFHSPTYFDQVADRCNLALAGHTHGGQVRLPLLGAVWFPPGCGGFDAGWYAAGTSRMYVSRGLGTSIFGMRFLCRPELAILRVGTENPSS